MDSKKLKLSRELQAKKEALKNEFSEKLIRRKEEIIEKDTSAVKKFFKAKGAGVDIDKNGQKLTCAIGKKSVEFKFSNYPHIFFGANFTYLVSIRTGKKTVYYFIVVIFDRSLTALKGGKNSIALKASPEPVKGKKTADIDKKIQSIKKAVAELKEKITNFDEIFSKISYSLRGSADYGENEIHKSKNLKEVLSHIFK